MKAGGSLAPALQRNFRWIVVRSERFAENLADSGGYDDLTTDAALSVFISAIVRHDPRVSHLYLDISAVAGLGDWEKKKQLIALRIRKLGVHRILFVSDGAWTSFTPIRAEAAFHELSLGRSMPCD
jgi:hypothetical protein